ncbi:tetratricopeptide repeat protein [Streptomyces sp. NPDC093586]|uniref:tetratricopeptide repeat protein n=1 Tax=Streptomyces sp. NPDC093586 TaxID=3366042 RepID=UPI0038064314
MAHHLRGVAYRELGRYPEAHADLDAALEICGAGSYEWNEAGVAHDVIRTLRKEGRTAEADIMARDLSAANPVFDRTQDRDGAVAVPDEDRTGRSLTCRPTTGGGSRSTPAPSTSSEPPAPVVGSRSPSPAGVLKEAAGTEAARRCPANRPPGLQVAGDRH